MLADLVQYNYLIFQLVKFNTETNIAEELLVHTSAVMPRSIQYQYSSRASIAQTVGSNEVDGFRENYGRGLTRVIISGTFGKKSRLVGTQYKSGWTRLLEFRELVFKLSNLIQGQSKRRIVGVNTSLYENKFLKDYEVIVVNFFDFKNNEKFTVNLDTFIIREDVNQNNLPGYTLTFTELGDVIWTDSKDVVLNTLLNAENVIGDILAKADTLMTNISSNKKLQEIAGAFQFANLALDSLGAGLTGVDSVIHLAGESFDVLRGRKFARKISGFKSIF